VCVSRIAVCVPFAYVRTDDIVAAVHKQLLRKTSQGRNANRRTSGRVLVYLEANQRTSDNTRLQA
jgi:hypothetical protein